MKWGERQAQILSALDAASDGASPSELARLIGPPMTTFLAAIYLARFRKQGILLKRVCTDGKCRYLLTPKGERKKAYLEMLGEE